MADCSCNNFPSSLGSVTFEGNVGINTTPATGLHVNAAMACGPYASTNTSAGLMAVSGSTGLLVFLRRTATSWSVTAGGDLMGFYNPDGTSLRAWDAITGDLMAIQ